MPDPVDDLSARRLLPLVGAFNFRDLGGYPAAGGTHTRWGRLFRSDTLQELTEDDLTLLRELGLRSVVDLRTPNEVVRDGRGLLGREPVHYVNVSVLPAEGPESVAAPAGADDDIGARYLWYLEAGTEALTSALRLVADPDRHPLVFHCTAGKDRTGVLSALVLGCLGVDHQVIVDDYMETQARLHLILDRLRQHPVYGAQLAETPQPRFGLRAENMARFLQLLDERYGGPAAWAASVGIDDATIASLRRSLLEPDLLGPDT